MTLLDFSNGSCATVLSGHEQYAKSDIEGSSFLKKTCKAWQRNKSVHKKDVMLFAVAMFLIAVRLYGSAFDPVVATLIDGLVVTIWFAMDRFIDSKLSTAANYPALVMKSAIRVFAFVAPFLIIFR